MVPTYGVIDLFAGPGGLGEGFAALVDRGQYPFQIGISVEKDPSAHRTLRLRAFLREVIRKSGNLPPHYVQFHAGLIDEPDWAEIDAAAWTAACKEARCLTLGTKEASEAIDREIERLRDLYEDSVLIGGPPCQAYSLAGRVRSRAIPGYRPEADERNFLFREYIRVLDRMRPAAFVLENVKGVLSAKVDGQPIFTEILADLASLGGTRDGTYEFRTLELAGDYLRFGKVRRPQDFIVRAEALGLPQKRHRVIVIGIRTDLAARADDVELHLPGRGPVSVNDVIGNLPRLRSALSREDSAKAWASVVTQAAAKLENLHRGAGDYHMAATFNSVQSELRRNALAPLSDRQLPANYGLSNSPLNQWLENDELLAIGQHDSRSHMPADLARYLYAATFGSVNKRSPNRRDFPGVLAPAHKSWEQDAFSDRFRVQLADQPSTTIVSHISKDGHYYIHPDPTQCRSLTVREAARLQTFPDDYLFLGNRTAQYVQVGNAVPPYLARQLAQMLLRVLRSSDAGTESDSTLTESEPVFS